MLIGFNSESNPFVSVLELSAKLAGHKRSIRRYRIHSVPST